MAIINCYQIVIPFVIDKKQWEGVFYSRYLVLCRFNAGRCLISSQ